MSINGMDALATGPLGVRTSAPPPAITLRRADARSHWGATGGATDGVWKALGSPLTGLMPECQGGRGGTGV